MMMLAYHGVVIDGCDEYYKLGNLTTMEALNNYAKLWESVLR